MVSQASKVSANLAGMRKSDTQAIVLLILPFSFLWFMLITLNLSFPQYILGQIVGGLFFAQAFILLHEFGHRSMFKTNKYNTFFGHFFSFLVFIPYYNWLEIHDLHHKWTGYRDKDPTTEKTFEDRLNSKQRNIINFCWKFYIPVFTLGYRFGIYWKAEKLKRHLPLDRYHKCLKTMKLYAFVYICLILIFPKFFLLILPALYMSFVICDILSLSQHSHIAMPVSNGAQVKPMNYIDQVPYSRSLKFPRFISEFILFNFNYHEAHHAYPGLPCYYLNQVDVESNNSFAFLPWLKKVKSMKGVDFIFKSDPNRKGF